VAEALDCVVDKLRLEKRPIIDAIQQINPRAPPLPLVPTQPFPSDASTALRLGQVCAAMRCGWRS